MSFYVDIRQIRNIHTPVIDVAILRLEFSFCFATFWLLTFYVVHRKA